MSRRGNHGRDAYGEGTTGRPTGGDDGLDAHEVPLDADVDGVGATGPSPTRGRDGPPGGAPGSRESPTEGSRAERIARLEALNGVVRGVNSSLASAGDREGIERGVCDHLAESDLYRTAWIADVPTWEGDADCWTGAGIDDGTSAPPAAVREAAVGTGERAATGVVVDDRERAWTLVPLVAGRTVYGAIGLCPGEDRPDDRSTVTDRERELLAELGGLIARTMAAVENRQLLATESLVELEFRSRDEDGTLLGAASRADCRLDVTGVVPDAGDGHLAYVRVGDGDAGEVTDALAGVSGSGARAIREADDGGLVEWTAPDATLVGTLARFGGNVETATAGDGTARYVVEVATDADARALVDRVRRDFPDTRLEAKRERGRPVDRADTVPDGAVENLTDRQAEVLEAAYRAGYFEWPRESTAEEVADALDIAAPTLHAHLRKAEGSLLAELFDREDPPE